MEIVRTHVVRWSVSWGVSAFGCVSRSRRRIGIKLQFIDGPDFQVLYRAEEAFKKHTLACLHSIGVAVSREYPALRATFRRVKTRR